MGTGTDVASGDLITAAKMNLKQENDGVGLTRVVHFSTFSCPNPGTDWTPTGLGVELGANLAAKICWCMLDGLVAGDIITAFTTLGDVTEAAAATLDVKLAYLDSADPITSNDVTNGGMTQVDADGVVDDATNNDDYTVVTDQMPFLIITGTCAAGDSIRVQGFEVSVTRLI